ncbi:hypothetical protein GCM10010922_26410 [Microbacterium sorbitolivorans]|uniref:LPXTG cell wall anchor domain-containing protein n=1 Tax=Microbacterium sorbitolivorans TaxID=1867410 RepID=UPI0013B04E47|nr:LPXTG cell wall anchor domain-containing protein [Microbacterium sorbitolivorans]GGF49237.1 hypothetical protein GCM10010922_26410 [Microbacterium sorbitolivorans]
MRFTFNRAAKLSAFGAAAALVASGVVAAPALAAEAAPQAELDQVAAEAFQVPGVVAVVTDGNGIQIKVADESGEGGFTALAAPVDGESISAEAIAAKFSNVEVVEGEQFDAISSDEVVGGAGYLSGSGDTLNSSCSLGFSAWDASGAPALVSAGHCMTEFGGSTFGVLSRPSTEPAVTGDENTAEIFDGEILGEYTFGQFGGPGNSTDGNTANGTDISFLGNINDKYTLLPAVTDWTGAPSDDHAASTHPVRSYGSAEVGDTITTSGRTTGAGEGTVREIGYANISGHIVYGFSAENNNSEDFAMPGDSGGGVLVGDKAVGVASGGGVGNFIWVTDLPDALRVASENGYDYQIALDIDEPAVAKATAVQGEKFTGTAPANSTVTIAGDIEATATTDESGNFSFAAPSKVGSFDITLTAKQGFNVSDTVNATVKTTEAPKPEAPAAPEVTSPANESSTTEAAPSITGTGVAGATVTLSGDAEGTATVGEDGKFSIPTELGFGKYTVGVTQTVNGLESETRWLTFSVVPGAPTIVTPGNGNSYVEGKLPAVIGTSPIDGAKVSVSLETADGSGVAGETTVEGGNWMVEFPNQLVAGNYTVSVTQSIAGVTSAAAESTFSVTAEGNGGGEEPTPAPTEEPTPTPAPEPSEEPTPAPSEEPTPAPAPSEQPGDKDDDGLAPTGATQSETVLPLAGGAALLMAAGAGLLLVRRKTRA